MFTMLKRHEVQVLLRAGHAQEEVARLTGMSERSVRRIGREEPISHLDDGRAVKERRIGRPSKVDAWREFVEKLFAKEPDLKSNEILRRAKKEGYQGGKSALYELIRSVRPKKTYFGMRFEGVAGEFTQHDFGEVEVCYADGSREKLVFFASRLKYSRWVEVSVVRNQRAETLVRTLVDHFCAMGGIPLLAVFDRPKTVALKWRKNGEVTEYNPIFAHTALELGIGVEVCWPRQPQQKGSVENLVGWVKNSYFKQRIFEDRDDLLAQLVQWQWEVNNTRPNRATERIPKELLVEEQARFRPVRITSDTLGLPVPIHVGPTAIVTHETQRYSMPVESAGFSGTLYLYPERVRIVAGRFVAEHPRLQERGAISTLPEHRAERLAKVSGIRGKRYLKRQDVLELGEVAYDFITELVHAKPKGWIQDVDEIWEALQVHGPDRVRLALHMAMAKQFYSGRGVLEELYPVQKREVK